MKKTIKYISVLSLFLLFFNSVCLATDINMNLQANTVTENTSTIEEEIPNSQQDTTLESSPNYTTVTNSNSTSDDGLTIGNIINIFLVVVGIVLILLGLAILIRLKY